MNKKAEKFLLELVKKNYNEIAESFNETRKKPMKPIVSEIIKNLNIEINSKVLDLGCGNGRFKKLLSKDVFYLGLDNSSELIKYAKDQQKGDFRCFDILSLTDLDEDSFDFVFSWAVFHHIPGDKLRKKILNDVCRKTKKNGIFVFSVWKLRKKRGFLKLATKSFFSSLIKGRLLDFGDLIFNWKGSKDGSSRPRYYHAFSKKSLKKSIKKSEFKINDFLEDDYNYYLILKK
jgi:SAM-dependent methyltransferase